MQTREGQRMGALVVLVASLVLYGGRHLSTQCTVREAPLPWGNQGPRMVAVEIVGDGTGEGIYFFQGERTLKEHLKIAGLEEKFDLVDIPDVVAAEGSAISISAEGGRLKIRELAASKRLALNLAVDVNDVSEEELLLIPGIGIKLAARIVQLRRERGGFEDISDLTAVEGIKGGKLNDLRKYLTVKKTP